MAAALELKSTVLFGKRIGEIVAQPVTTVLTEVTTIVAASDVRQPLLRLRGTVADNALNGITITTAMKPGGVHRNYLVDADLDSISSKLPWSSPQAGYPIYQTPAGGKFEIELNVANIAELKILCKSATGTANVLFEAVI